MILKVGLPLSAYLQRLSDKSAELGEKNYVLIRDSDLFEAPDEVRGQFQEKLFSTLQNDMPDVHANRQRARDVVRYTRQAVEKADLEEAESITIKDRNYSGERDYKRVPVLRLPGMQRLLASILAFVPGEHRTSHGTIGINMFRTFGVTTNNWHQDGEDFVVVYCVAKHGGGAITKLSLDRTGKEIFLEHPLAPGELLMFKDAAFFHHTTELVPINGQPKDEIYRDAFAITIDAPAS